MKKKVMQLIKNEIENNWLQVLICIKADLSSVEDCRTYYFIN